MEKRRRNALDRVTGFMSDNLTKYAFRIDCDSRILYTPTSKILIHDGATSAEIRTIINGQIRMIEESRKMTAEIVHEKIAEKIQDKLLCLPPLTVVEMKTY